MDTELGPHYRYAAGFRGSVGPALLRGSPHAPDRCIRPGVFAMRFLRKHVDVRREVKLPRVIYRLKLRVHGRNLRGELDTRFYKMGPQITNFDRSYIWHFGDWRGYRNIETANRILITRIGTFLRGYILNQRKYQMYTRCDFFCGLRRPGS